MNAILSKIWGWVAGAAALIVAAAGLYLRGRSTGRGDERQERETAVAKQQAAAQEVVREVENEINQTDDAGIIDRANRWVRKPGSDGR